MSQETDGLGRTRGAHRQDPPWDDENTRKSSIPKSRVHGLSQSYAGEVDESLTTYEARWQLEETDTRPRTVAQEKKLASEIRQIWGQKYLRSIWSGACTVKLRDRFDLYYETTDEEENEEIHLYKRSEVAVRIWAAIQGNGKHSTLRFVPRIYPHCQLRWPPEQGEWRAEEAKRVRETVTEWNRGRACERQPNSAYGVPCSVLLSGPQLDALEQNYHEISSKTDLRRLIPSWEWLDKYGDELVRAIQSGRSRQHSSETSRDLRLCPNTASYMGMLDVGFIHLKGAAVVHGNHPSNTHRMAQTGVMKMGGLDYMLPILTTQYNPMKYVWKKLKATLLERNPYITQEPSGPREEILRDLQYSLQCAWKSIPDSFFQKLVSEHWKQIEMINTKRFEESQERDEDAESDSERVRMRKRNRPMRTGS